MSKVVRVKRDFYINILEDVAQKTKIDLIAWVLLYKKYGVDIFYILNLMAGQIIRVPSHRTLVDIVKKAKTKPDTDEFLEIPIDNE